MHRHEILFAFALATAAQLIIVGVALVSVPAGFIAAGVLTAVWSWLVLSGVEPSSSTDDGGEL